MRIETIVATKEPEIEFANSNLPDASVLFYFMSPDYPHKNDYMATLKKSYPDARLIGCSTGGEIAGDEALVNTAVSAAVRFKHTVTKISRTDISEIADSFDAGVRLGKDLYADDLKFIFILADGLRVNGNELIRGIIESTREDIILTGGFAGDGFKFKETAVGVDGLPETGKIAAIGFYGDKLRVSYGTAGGWIKFGMMRHITKSKGNVLYELDDKNALELYKKYLGEHAKDLPASGQYYPLSIRPTIESEHEIVRAFSAIDEEEQSLLFAGDIPEGYIAQLMQGTPEDLAEGAAAAAKHAVQEMEKQGGSADNALALLVSCVGRNMMMGHEVSDEIEAVEAVLDGIPLAGFYSYGEICNHSQTGKCDYHNQTMTITIISEDE